MTEQTPRFSGFVEELGPLFAMWGDEDGRECLGGDLATRGGAEMEREFRYALDFLDGLVDMAENTFGVGAYVILLEAKRHAAKARSIAAGYAEGGRT